jgi:hypothetical protein
MLEGNPPEPTPEELPPEQAGAPGSPEAPPPTSGPAPRLRSLGGWLPRSLIVIAVAMLALTFATALVVVSVGSQSGSSNTSATPEAAYRAYLAAIQSGDFATAESMLSSRARSAGLDPRTLGPESQTTFPTPTIEGVLVAGDTATLRVRLISGDIGIDATVYMVLENGAWKIDSEGTY